MAKLSSCSSLTTCPSRSFEIIWENSYLDICLTSLSQLYFYLLTFILCVYMYMVYVSIHVGRYIRLCGCLCEHVLRSHRSMLKSSWITVTEPGTHLSYMAKKGAGVCFSLPTAPRVGVADMHCHVQHLSRCCRTNSGPHECAESTLLGSLLNPWVFHFK